MERGPAEQPGGMGDKKHYYHYPVRVRGHPFASEGDYLSSNRKFVAVTRNGLTTDITTDVFETLFNLGLFDKV